MKVALYGKTINSSFTEGFKLLLNNLCKNNISLIIFKPFNDFLTNSLKLNCPSHSTFNNYHDIPTNIDLIISIGGDGTFLETISIIKEKPIPILGINTGRLGFLATVSQYEIDKLIECIINNDFIKEERTLLKLENKEVVLEYNHVLNDITIQKSGSELITIHTYLNGEFLNSYWSDGLIIATPTGSTAYTLSVGGPVVLPNSENFIISPIAPHTLSVRPVVIPDHFKITLRVETRNSKYILSLDHQSTILNNSVEINILKGDYKIKMVKLPYTSYYETLRNKLMWGIDIRN